MVEGEEKPEEGQRRQIPSAVVMRRLELIRYMFDLAVKQSRQPQLRGGLSIVMFHDSIDLFLQLACEYCKLDSPKGDAPSLMKNCQNLNTSLESMPIQARQLNQLNEARANVKHSGNFPSEHDVEKFRAIASEFFEDITPRVFGIPFDHISLVDLVACDEARTNLTEACAWIEKGNRAEAMRHVGDALNQVLADYQRKIQWTALRPGNTTPLRMIHFNLSRNASDDDMYLRSELGSRVEELQDQVFNLQTTITILGTGLDFGRYLRFQRLTGRFAILNTDTLNPPESDQPTEEDCDFCARFVIETALQLQETFDSI